jgi:hypothetical protein
VSNVFHLSPCKRAGDIGAQIESVADLIASKLDESCDPKAAAMDHGKKNSK